MFLLPLALLLSGTPTDGLAPLEPGLAQAGTRFDLVLRPGVDGCRLLLSDAEDLVGNRAVVERAAQVFGIDVKPFLQLLEAREEKAKLKTIDAVQLLGSYLRELSIVVDAVDRLEKE